jgi:hypothetical protein
MIRDTGEKRGFTARSAAKNGVGLFMPVPVFR